MSAQPMAPPIARKPPPFPVAKFAIGGSVAMTALILVTAFAVRSSRKQEAEDARKAEEAKRIDAQIEQGRKARLERERASQLEEEAERSREATDLTINSSKVTRAERDSLIWQCVQATQCPQWKLDAVIAGAPSGPERTHASLVSFAATADHLARTQGKDGSEISTVPAGLIAGLVARPDHGLKLLDVMSTTTVQEAKKDPDSVRGRVLKVAGTVLEIHQSGELTDGAISTGSSFVRFVTAMPSDGIYENQWATFKGVFLQQFEYPNVSGGTTQTVLVVGAFDTPANRKR